MGSRERDEAVRATVYRTAGLAEGETDTLRPKLARGHLDLGKGRL